MASISIPKKDIEALQNYLKLSINQKEKIIGYLKNAPRNVSTKDLNIGIASLINESEDDCRPIITLLLSTLVTLVNTPITKEDIIEQLYISVTGEKSIEDSTHSSVLDDITTLLNVENINLKLLAKSMISTGDVDAVFQGARVSSDIKPIVIEKKVEGSMIYHHLKISYSTESSEKEFSVTLDNADLEQLFKTLANAKEEAEIIQEYYRSDLIYNQV
ncbi:MAG: hypothetical protein ACO1NU_04360 [Arcticibacter sp.]